MTKIFSQGSYKMGEGRNSTYNLILPRQKARKKKWEEAVDRKLRDSISSLAVDGYDRRRIVDRYTDAHRYAELECTRCSLSL